MLIRWAGTRLGMSAVVMRNPAYTVARWSGPPPRSDENDRNWAYANATSPNS